MKSIIIPLGIDFPINNTNIKMLAISLTFIKQK